MIEAYKRLGKLAMHFGWQRLTGYIIFSVLVVIVAALATFSVAPLMKVAMGGEDEIVVLGREMQLSTAVVAFSIAQLLLFAVSSIGAWFQSRYVAQFGAWLRVKLLQRVMEREYNYFAANEASVVQQTVNHYTSQVALLIYQAMDLLVKILLMVGFSSVALCLNPVLSLIILLVGIIYYTVVITVFKKVRKKVSLKMIESADEMQSFSLQTIQGVKLLRISEREDIFINQYSIAAKVFAKNQIIPPLLGILPKHLLELILMLVFGMYLWRLDATGTLLDHLPQLSVMIFVVFKVFPLMQGVYSLYNGISAQEFLIKKVSDEFEEARQKPKPEKIVTFKKSIELKNLQFAYPETDRLIEFPNLSIKMGETVGIRGASGSGKSTLMDLLLGLYTPTEGEVLVDGVSAKPEELHTLYEKIGYVGQDPFLLNLTIAENIALEIPENIDNRKLEKAASLAQISEHIGSLKEGYQTVVGDRGVRLSGGQRQRIAIARALYNEPNILFLDEATSALDEATENRIMNTIYSLPEDMTIVMIAHRLSTLERADKIINLDTFAEVEESLQAK